MARPRLRLGGGASVRLRRRAVCGGGVCVGYSMPISHSFR
uniref:Uncharacterized protein n=1 Tax=Siphoviridae sp. ctQ091 TaxID=2825490 RepID=A0A8S5NTM4_9CAUD|nr:MAG TPA: hypothetical protein [Siphoviridae sp. ctQ091]